MTLPDPIYVRHIVTDTGLVSSRLYSEAQMLEFAKNNGGKTGWPPGLLQDDCYALARWLSSRSDALHKLRELYSEKEELK